MVWWHLNGANTHTHTHIHECGYTSYMGGLVLNPVGFIGGIHYEKSCHSQWIQGQKVGRNMTVNGSRGWWRFYGLIEQNWCRMNMMKYKLTSVQSIIINTWATKSTKWNRLNWIKLEWFHCWHIIFEALSFKAFLIFVNYMFSHSHFLTHLSYFIALKSFDSNQLSKLYGAL